MDETHDGKLTLIWRQFLEQTYALSAIFLQIDTLPQFLWPNFREIEADKRFPDDFLHYHEIVDYLVVGRELCLSFSV